MLASWVLDAPLARALVGMPFDVADAGRLDRLADVEGLVARFERRVAEAREVSDAAADLVQRLRSRQDMSTPAEQEAAVEVLLAAERNLGEVLGRILTEARDNEDMAALHAPQLLAPFRRMTALIEEEMHIYLEAARDVRWEALALLAEAEPLVDGPVLSSPDDLDEYFQSLRSWPDAPEDRAPCSQGARKTRRKRA